MPPSIPGHLLVTGWRHCGPEGPPPYPGIPRRSGSRPEPPTSAVSATTRTSSSSDPDSEINSWDRGPLGGPGIARLFSPGPLPTLRNPRPLHTSISFRCTFAATGPGLARATRRTPATCDNCRSRAVPPADLLPWLLGQSRSTPECRVGLTFKGDAVASRCWATSASWARRLSSARCLSCSLGIQPSPRYLRLFLTSAALSSISACKATSSLTRALAAAISPSISFKVNINGDLPEPDDHPCFYPRFQAPMPRTDHRSSGLGARP